MWTSLTVLGSADGSAMTRYYSHIDGIDVYDSCLTVNEGTPASSALQCALRCHKSALPYPSPGFTYLSNASCSCWPMPSGIDAAPSTGAFLGESSRLPGDPHRCSCINLKHAEYNMLDYPLKCAPAVLAAGRHFSGYLNNQ